MSPPAAPAAGGGQAAAPGVANTQTVAATKRSRAYAKLKAGKLRIDAQGPREGAARRRR